MGQDISLGELLDLEHIAPVSAQPLKFMGPSNCSFLGDGFGQFICVPHFENGGASMKITDQTIEKYCSDI